MQAAGQATIPGVIRLLSRVDSLHPRDIINLYGKPVVSKERSATSPLQKDNQNNGDTDA